MDLLLWRTSVDIMGDKKAEETMVRRSQRYRNGKDEVSTTNTRGQDGGGQNTHTAGASGGDETVHQKLDKITGMLADALKRLDNVENAVKTTTRRVNTIEDSLHSFNEILEELKSEQKQCARKTDVDALKMKVDDLSNRSRRNNIVVWGIPEGSEDSSNCVDLMQELFEKHMEIEDADSFEIERAHRSPMGKMAYAQIVRRKSPRPIHVKMLRYNDREKILREAPKKLKNNEYKGSKVYISDDVTDTVRAERKQLMKIRNKVREDGKFAIVPWTVPACLLVKIGEGKFKRFTVNNVSELKSLEQAETE